MILSQGFCFRGLTDLSTCIRSHVYIIYKQVFFRYNHFHSLRSLHLVPSIIHFESGAEFCKPLRRSRPMHTHNILRPFM
jgi:hypothetical protein